jgi:thiol-disulfide isomerase/thioredoxin
MNRLSTLTLAGAIIVLALSACAHKQTTPAEHPGYAAVAASSDLQGKKVGPAPESTSATLVVFFASWCHACQDELKMLTDFRHDEPGLRIIGLNAYEDYRDFSDSERLRAYLDANAPWLRVVPANKEMMGAFDGVPKIPTMFLFDREGNLIKEFRRDKRRPPSAEELSAAIAEANQNQS